MRRLLRLFELLAVIVVRELGSLIMADLLKMVLGVVNSFLLWERAESLNLVMRRFMGRFGLFIARSAVINCSFESLFRLKQLCLSLMTDDIF